MMLQPLCSETALDSALFSFISLVFHTFLYSTLSFKPCNKNKWLFLLQIPCLIQRMFYMKFLEKYDHVIYWFRKRKYTCLVRNDNKNVYKIASKFIDNSVVNQQERTHDVKNFAQNYYGTLSCKAANNTNLSIEVGNYRSLCMFQWVQLAGEHR